MLYPKLIESKTSTNEIVFVEWNPGMDMLATLFDNQAIACCRLLSLQKVWSKQPELKIISVAWRPDGRVIALACHDEKTNTSRCLLNEVESGEEIHVIETSKPISCIGWFQYEEAMSTRLDDKNLNDLGLFSCKADKIGDHRNEPFSHKLALDQKQLNILVIATDDGKVDLYSLGLFHLAQVTMSNEGVVRKLRMSKCLNYVTNLISGKQNTGSNTKSIIKMSTLNDRRNEILRVSKMYARISDELDFLNDTINAISTSWVDALAGLDDKISSYCCKTYDDDGNPYTFVGSDDLLQLLIFGQQSYVVEKFIHAMSDKGLKKLNNVIEQTCTRIQNLNVKNAQKCCYHLHEDINHLKGMALWRERYQDVGLDDYHIVEALRSVGTLMLKLTELQQVIDHSLKSAKAFFKWLISVASRTSGEQNADVFKMTEQDVDLITDFIVENFGRSMSVNDSMADKRPTCSNFTFEQIGQYLKNENLTRKKYSFLKPGSNFWIDFFGDRPELSEIKRLQDGSSVFLFYPHNPDTSLIQEHQNTNECIKRAFEVICTNLSKRLDKSKELISVRDLWGVCSSSRVRTEIDCAAMRHYTMFQTTNTVPAARQYIWAQSLDTNSKWFDLVSIEFKCKPHSFSGGGGTSRSSSALKLLISDSCFYEDRDSHRLLATYLLINESHRDTIIAQLDVNDVISDKLQARSIKESPRMCAKPDSVDRYSRKVELVLNVHSEPAEMREHSLAGIMAKRIRNTIGTNMFASSNRGVIAFTSNANKRLSLYELECVSLDTEFLDDELEGDERIDESYSDADMAL